MDLKELVPTHWGRSFRHRASAERHPLESLHREIDRIFEDVWGGFGRSTFAPEDWSLGDVAPRIDETEDEKGYHIAAELPGMDEKDIELTLSDGMLTICGEKKQESEDKKKNYYRAERSFGVFRRSIPLPAEVDESKVAASFDKGVLTIDLPKTKAAQKKAKRIAIKAR